MTETRQERTIGVRHALRTEEKLLLVQLLQSSTWPVLLDVMEMTCIGAETVLIRTPPENERLVLANHKMALAHWDAFVNLQARVIQISAEMTRTEEVEPEPTEQDRIDALLDPTRDFGE